LLTALQSVSLEGNKIKETYLFSERVFKAHDIETISINRRILNFGRGPRAHNFIEIQTKSGYIISMEYFYSEIPDRYNILKGWHEKHTNS
jgi:hypothetical protein